ncbi:MAG TPA: FMN-binding negative transcriptional regulator, partial [Steroidobacteraceae bacterium]
MYVPEHFRETRIDVLRALVERYSLATLVAATAQGISANHIPMQLIDTPGDGQGLVHGHMARANPLWRLLP